MILYLLTNISEHEDGAIEVNGRFWRLCPYDLDEFTPESLEFICISYSWGLGREPSPFHDDFMVSDRTVPALVAVARLRPACKHIWVDAFCVPLEEPERCHTLESMGYIYSRAHEVIAVLSDVVLPSLISMQKDKQLAEQYMFEMEKDEWVTRAWTYQEAVNARCLFITCEDSGDVIISGQDFINYLGCALAHLSIRALERRALYPRLDALEDLVDYLTADYQERSALQVMAKMDRRFHGRPEDHFYAMIGAISSSLGSSTGAVDACEAFMRICERKGDFSFIYSVAPRAPEAGRRWRPVPGDLPAVLQWDSWGSGEPGRITHDGLLLESVVQLCLGDVSTEADHFIRNWLRLIRQVPEGARPTDVSVHVFDALRLMGFTGPSDSLATPAGLFFPVRLVSPDEVESVFISSSLRWVFGSPGILCCQSTQQVSYVPGILVGTVKDCSTMPVTIG
ncbi:hypothetical protein VM1G_04443 [Cytospora mali]|uniref:Heterokaryon incompatibility domain-containing protein n=1 Tax=Cytospora mali TaxID=578113 RepID=A0A194VXL9_CYTMA|nr:hypothetical protein VM1G_04443 [Valsa mali]